MKKIFLETNSYSRYATGENIIKKQIDESREVLISVVTLGELYLGFREGNREYENLKLLNAFLAERRVKVISISKKTSQEYGKIKYELRRKGTPIPENDIWIAAQVIETGSELVSYDDHFLKIKGLKVWKKLSAKN